MITPPRAMMTARSTVCSSWRTLPGQSEATSACIASSEIRAGGEV